MKPAHSMFLVTFRPDFALHSSEETLGTSSRWRTGDDGPDCDRWPHPLTVDMRMAPMVRPKVPLTGGRQMGIAKASSVTGLCRRSRAMSLSALEWLYRGWTNTLDTFLVCSVPSSFPRMCSPAAEDKMRPKEKIQSCERRIVNSVIWTTPHRYDILNLHSSAKEWRTK